MRFGLLIVLGATAILDVPSLAYSGMPLPVALSGNFSDEIGPLDLPYMYVSSRERSVLVVGGGGDTPDLIEHEQEGSRKQRKYYHLALGVCAVEIDLLRKR